MNDITTQKAINSPARYITPDLDKMSLTLTPSGKDKNRLHKAQAMQRNAQKCICSQAEVTGHHLGWWEGCTGALQCSDSCVDLPAAPSGARPAHC